MSRHAAVTAAFLEKILALLAPIFLAGAKGDMAAARDAVNTMLANYQIRNDDELRLVALTIAFGFGALDALGRAVDPALPLNQIMRLRSNATALSRAGHQNQAVLDKLRKQEAAEPTPEPEPEPAEPSLPATAETSDLVAFVRSALKPQPQTAAPAVPLSRQQRRAAERQAEKDQRRREHEARRAALLASRTTEPPTPS